MNSAIIKYNMYIPDINDGQYWGHTYNHLPEQVHTKSRIPEMFLFQMLCLNLFNVKYT